MLILAKTIKGQEFMYNPRTAHSVSKSGMKRIKDALNRIGYKLDNDSQIWHEYEIDQYDIVAYESATIQAFKTVNHSLREYGAY